MIISRKQTPVGEATWTVFPFGLAYYYPNEAEITIVWGFARVGPQRKWRFFWNDAV
jgi:hypothetical protein